MYTGYNINNLFNVSKMLYKSFLFTDFLPCMIPCNISYIIILLVHLIGGKYDILVHSKNINNIKKNMGRGDRKELRKIMKFIFIIQGLQSNSDVDLKLKHLSTWLP